MFFKFDDVSDATMFLILRCERSEPRRTHLVCLGLHAGQHLAGLSTYTSVRRPVRLVWADNFIWITDAIAFERKLKGWSRAKKQALIRGDWAAISALAKRRGGAVRPSRPPSAAPQDEEDLG